MARSEIQASIARSDSGAPITGASVTITKRDASAATVYADETGGTTITQPLTSNKGAVTGWLDDGSYTLTVTYPGLGTRTEYLEQVSGATVASLVPYSGATADINIGTHTLSASNVNGVANIGAGVEGGFTSIYPRILADRSFSTSVFGDAVDAFVIEARGRLRWGSGSAATDVTLYRNGVDVLKTDDHFVIAPPAAATAGLSVSYQGSTHAVIFNRTAGNPSNGNVLLVTAQDTGTDANPQDTTFGLSGYETGKGTFKVSHNKPVASVTGSDANASAISLRVNGTGTAAQMIFGDAEQVGGTTGKLINLRQNGVETFVVGPTGDILIGGYNVNDWETAMQASWVYTMPDYLAQTALTLATGTKYGAVAFARKAGVYNNVVICTGATVPSGVTDLKMAVWDSSGTLLAATASAHGTIIAGSTVYETPLTSSVTLTAGQRIYIGINYIGTTFQIRGASQISGMVGTRTGRTFATARANGSWAGGAVTSLTTGGTGIVPWAELT